MPRKALKPRERHPLPPPDSTYNSQLVSRFLNKLNFWGKKSTAEKIFDNAMKIIKEKTKEEPVNVFHAALENCRPLVEVRPRRVGGATYQVPMEVSVLRSNSLAMRWLISFARARTGKPMADRLAQEFIDASKKEGSAMKKREDTHKMAEANKAFAHYRW